MKKESCLVVVCGFVFSTLFSAAQTPTADTIVHRTFAALKAGDKKAFVALFPAYEPFKKFMLQTMVADKKRRIRTGDTTLPVNVDSLEQEFVANLTKEAYTKEVAGNFSKPFQKTMEQGLEKGLNWQRAVLTHYTLVKTPETEGIPVMEGVMEIRDSTQEYQLAFDQIIWFEPEGSWFGINLKNLVRKGEPLEGDFSVVDSPALPDSMVLMQDTTALDMAPTHAPVKKNSQQKPVRKQAAKAQPARKPNANVKPRQ